MTANFIYFGPDATIKKMPILGQNLKISIGKANSMHVRSHPRIASWSVFANGHECIYGKLGIFGMYGCNKAKFITELFVFDFSYIYILRSILIICRKDLVPLVLRGLSSVSELI